MSTPVPQGGYLGKAQAWTGRVTNNLTGQAEQLKGKFAGSGQKSVSHLCHYTVSSVLVSQSPTVMAADCAAALILRHQVQLEHQTQATQQELEWGPRQISTTAVTREAHQLGTQATIVRQAQAMLLLMPARRMVMALR